MKWISVKDRLPESNGRYLIYEQKSEHLHNCLSYDYPYPCCEPNIAYYEKDRDEWKWHSLNKNRPFPTHWMLLPDDPEK